MDPFLVHLLVTVVVGLFPLGVGYWVYTRGRGRPALLFAALLGAITLMAEGLALQMVVDDPVVVEAIHYLRGAFGLTTGPLWFLFALYFTGREEYATRRLVGGIAAIAGTLAVLQALNPLHGLTHPTMDIVTEPFRHLVVTNGPLFWVGWAFSYVLVFAGLGMLFHLFLRSRYVSRQQPAVVMLSTGFPIGINIAELLGWLPVPTFPYTVFGLCMFSAVTGIAIFSHQLFDLTPLARDRVVATIDNPVVVIDDDGRLIDYNGAAQALFPDVESNVGATVATVAPRLIAEAGDDRFVDSLTVFRDEERRTFSVSVTPIDVGPDRSGYALVLKDVTDLQTYARRLEQQTDQLERVAGTISHDLRNPLTVAEGAIELARDDGDAEQLDRASDALERIQQIVDDTLELAREGQAIGDQTLVPFATVVRDAWETSDTAGATLECGVDDDFRVYADEGRLRTVFENLFRNAVEHGSTDPRSSTSHEDAVEHGSASPPSQAHENTVEHGEANATVRAGLLRDDGDVSGFYVEDDGPGIPESARDEIFEIGHTTDSEGTGFGLAIVDSIATAHGWDVSVTSGADGGARFEFRGVDVVDAAALHGQPVSPAD